MRILTFSLSIFLFVFLLISCGTEPTPIYTLSTSVVGEGTITPSGGEFEEGEVVKISGIPGEQWVLSSWSGDVTGSANTISITMDSDKNVVGTFSERLFPLNITVEGEGSVTEDIIHNKSEHAVGTVVQLTSIPVNGWVFHEWSGDLDGINNPQTIEINEGMEVTSVFKSIDELLTTEINGEGTVNIHQESFEDNPSRRMVTLSPIPSSGWKFVEWSDWEGEVDEDDRIVVTVDAEVSVSATFEQVDYPLTITIEGEGIVNQEVVQSKTTEYPYETVIQLTPVPSEDYEFVEWNGDISSTDDIVTVTMNGVLNVTATFRHVLDGRILEQANGHIQEETNYPSPETSVYSTTWDYDTHGNLTNFVSFDSDDTISYKDVYTYDVNNNRIEETRYDPDDSITYKITYTYNSDNYLTEQIYYDSNGSISVRFTYTYDSNNNLTERILYNSSGSVSLKNTYTYHFNNNLTEQIYYSSDNSVLGRDTYTYDSNNNLAELIYYEADDSVVGKDIYTYDSSNNLIQWDYNSDTSNWITEYEYDFNGKLTNIHDVYNFLRSDSWYKTITTENRENIYYERSMKISSQNRSPLKSKNQQVIREFNSLNRNSDRFYSPNRDLLERLDVDFLPNPYLHHPTELY